MKFDKTHIRLAVVVTILAGGLLPVFFYWVLVGRCANVSPEEARDLLAARDSPWVLVDVRAPGEFEAGHPEGARNWPYGDILLVDSLEGIPPDLKERSLLMICQGGIRSSLAAQKLEDLGLRDVRNVRGGIQAWVASAEHREAFRESPRIEQWTVLFYGFVVKPAYMLLSLVLIIVLWRRRSPDLAALRWAFLSFLIGESLCAVNYIFLGNRSYAYEYLHSLGMVLCFGFATYAILEALDLRIVRFTEPDGKCAALSLCHRCIKYSAEVPCGLKRLFYFAIPAAMSLCFLPLVAEMVCVSYNTEIVGSFYNFSHPAIYQIFEIRYCPAAAIALFAISFVLLRFKRHDPITWSKVFFSAGAGALAFSLLRLVIFHAFRENLVWFEFWEEATELLFVLGAAYVLWVFRRGLF